MTAHFFKYQGTGNDFIIFDNRKNELEFSADTIALICHRRFGIGADGMMFLLADEKFDFGMKYYNADGKEGSMCGNGGRCLVSFAKRLGIIGAKTSFKAVDGVHQAEVTGEETVRLKMADVEEITSDGKSFFLNTGSPHHVEFVNEVKAFDVFNSGKEIRYNKHYQPSGTNVNFVELLDKDTIFVRTYERGVEDETLSCGTGVTASSLAAAIKTNSDQLFFNCKTLGGDLKVSFRKIDERNFKDIYLEGPGKLVYEGDIIL